ncbi:MAG: hypothetical protein QOG43_2669 [Actinomycetota bacterium]|nr:hypothetical protein [Actinomycetota bacterium]
MSTGSLGAFGGYGRSGGGRIWRGHTPAKVTAAIAAFLIACSVLLAPNANAFLFVVPAPSFPDAVTVGQTFPASIGVTNASTPPESTATPVLTLSQIDLYPACSNQIQDCTGGTAEAGVFALSGTGTGSSTPAGNATCEGTWTIVPDTGNVNTASRYRFIPPGGEGTLQLATGQTCAVSFTATTLRVPTIDANTGLAGVQTNQVVSATFNPGGFRNSGPDQTTIAQATPALSTAAAQVGTTVPGTTSDVATLDPPPPPSSGLGAPPTGTITFNLFGPADTTCAGPPVFTNTVPVDAGFGDYPTSASATITTPGTYRWVATYSGDANYIGSATVCGDPVENVAFTEAVPTIVTSALTPVTIGSPINDTATVTGVGAGVPAPTGTVTFTLFGPANATCTGAPIFTSAAVPLTGGPPPTANSGNFTPTAPGTYNWIAVYSGDANYTSVTSPCGAANESSVVNQAVASVATTATPAVTIGSPISDTATVTGGATPAPTPTGTVTFTLFGPGNATCTGAPIFTSAAQPIGGGPPPTANSGPFTPTAPGTYNWVAVYSGDANYPSATSPCGAANEASVVNQSVATIVTSAMTPVTVGSPISDTATVTGGVAPAPAPTGTVTFTLFGPANPTCTGAPIFTSATRPLAGGPPPTATSATFVPPGPGTYNWVAVYSGDANYPSVTSPCGAANEASVVTQAPVAIATTATPSAPAGGPISDTATVTGGVAPAPAPTGTVTFTLFGPANPTCTGAPIFTSATRPLGGGPPPTATSATFVPPGPGTYNWVAVYSGDGNYPSATSPCGAANEASIVNQAAITTAATPAVTIGSPVSDTATVNGGTGPVPTGTVTFTLFGPGNPTCTGAPIFTSAAVPLAGGPPPTANSGNFTPTAVGTYNWVAVYSGDAAYPTATSACGAANEASVVSAAQPTIATQALSPVTLTQAIRDTATVTGAAGAPTPTGTVTFTLFGPSNPTCTGAPIFTSAARPLAGGPPPTATSADFTPTAVGTYNWVAVYSGDANNATVTSPCGAPNEASVITSTPTINVDKTATPLTLPEPGGDFTFNVVVTNTSTEVLTITSLTDNIYGNIADPANPNITSTTCNTAVGTALQPSPGPGNTYSCSFVAPFTGNGGDNQTDIVTVTGTNPAGVVVTDFDDAIVTLTDVPPDIQITKVASPLTRNEPGGAFTYNLLITNPSTLEAVTITSLNDNPYGNLDDPANPNVTNNTCLTAVGTVLAVSPGPGNTYSCSFTANFTGNAGDSRTDTVTVVGVDDDGTPVTATASAIVRITDVLPIIAVDKTVVPPAALPEPGGTFTFNVVVTNLSPEAVTITSLTDNIYGNLVTRPGSTCNTAIGTVLAANPGPGNTYTCSFTGPFNGNAGAQQTDVVTAIAVDNDGDTATDFDDATVTITNVLPAIMVEKSASPTSRPEPGGSFQFNVVVTNTGPEALTITSLTDNIHGNIATQGTCTTAIGTVLQPGGSYSCSFPGTFTGNAGAQQTDIVTVVGVDNDGTSASDTDDATVTLTGVPPTVDITKTPAPSSLPEPGGQFTFNFVVTNTSNESVTVTDLTDDVYGNLNGKGTCATGAVLAPGAQYKCAFTVTFTGPPGAHQTDVVTVRVVDDDGQSAIDTDDAVITITDVPPQITVVKTANPLVRNEPGGTFTFSVTITNTGPEDVTITDLTDDVYGNLNGRGTCAVGAVLQHNGGTYSCSFNADFFGNGGASQTDVVTASGVDNEGSRTTARDDAVVRLVDVPPTVTVVKDAEPASRPEPGGAFTFLVTVNNTSFEPVTVVSLTDDVYGNLNGRGTCAIGAVIPAGGSYRCQFTVDYRAPGGSSQIDRVFVTVVDNEGSRASANDDARISITPLAPIILPVVVAPPPTAAPAQLSRTGSDVGGPARLAFGLLIAGLLLVGATWGSGSGGRLRLALAPGGGPGRGPGRGPRKGPGGMTRFRGSQVGDGVSRLVAGAGGLIRSAGAKAKPTAPSEAPTVYDWSRVLGPDDVVVVEAAGPDDEGTVVDDSEPDDEGPEGPAAGGPSGGVRPPSGPGPAGGGSAGVVDDPAPAPATAPEAGSEASMTIAARAATIVPGSGQGSLSSPFVLAKPVDPRRTSGPTVTESTPELRVTRLF